MTYKDKLRRAFDSVYDHYGFFSSFVMEWEVVETPCACPDKRIFMHLDNCPMPYAATDGPHLFLNPGFMDTLNIAETLYVILHEAGHIFLGHMYRVPFNTLEDKRDAHEWNIAMDEALNDTMSAHFNDRDNQIAQVMIFPGRMHKTGGDMFLSHPKGRDAEFYHELVKKSRPKQPQPPQSGQGQPQSGTGLPSGGPGEGSSTGQSGQNGSSNGKIPTSPTPGTGSSKRSDLPESIGDILPHPVLATGDAEAVAEAVEEWKQEVAQAINNARMQGDLPGWVEELGNTLYGQQSKQNWRALLRRWMTRTVSFGGQTYDKPNRRQSYRRDIIVPANRSRQASKGCVLVDTSGSMSAEQCNAALSEMEAILRIFPRCDVDLIMADTRLIERSKKNFHRYDFPFRLPMEWLGRGGTDLRAPIMGVADDRSYKWLVVISDMQWSAAQAINPGIPTIFVWTPMGGEKQPYQVAPFGVLVGPVES